MRTSFNQCFPSYSWSLYYRLKRLREEALRQDKHEIVAVRVSMEETKAITANAGVI